jgi:hypothetical protein
MKAVLVTVTVAILTGCATISEAECQKPFDVGFRDAIFGLQPQDTLYAPMCNARGRPLDTVAYAQGWQEGKYEFDRRKVHGGAD